ncbi:MAG: HPr family phosphocarrier protein [Lachnospiraceae bacterium]|nr:HPr family phosphocarrier protein [Lachnospiraceae bacterium]
MKKFSYTVKDEVGIHARPAGLLVKEAKKYASKIVIDKDGKTAEAGKLMAVMGLGVKCGQTVEVTITGEDEDVAYEALKEFFENNL